MLASPAPRVSVLLPVYNGLPHLGRAAESMLAQTYRDLELLVVDDGSTDGSAAVLAALAAGDARVRVLRHAGGVNRGLVASLNLGLSEARGEFIARMDADDRSYPERIAKQVAYLDAHPNVGVLGTQADSFDGHEWSVWGAYADPVWVRWHLMFTTPMVHPTVTMRRAAVAAVGGYDAAYPHLEDYKFFYDLSKVTELANLPEPLLEFNRDIDTNVSTRHRRTQFDTCLRVHREVFADYGVPLPERHAAMVSACLFAKVSEAEEAHGPLSLADVDAVGRAQHRLARAFARRWQVSEADRAEIEATLRWRGSQLVDHAVTRGLAGPRRARAMRLSWGLGGTARRALRRLAPR